VHPVNVTQPHKRELLVTFPNSTLAKESASVKSTKAQIHLGIEEFENNKSDTLTFDTTNKCVTFL
jgi:hypothetical protein